MWDKKSLLGFFVLLHSDRSSAFKDVYSWRNITSSTLLHSSTIHTPSVQTSLCNSNNSNHSTSTNTVSSTSTFTTIIRKQELPLNKSDSGDPAGWHSSTVISNSSTTATLNGSIPFATSNLSLSANTAAVAFTTVSTVSAAELPTAFASNTSLSSNVTSVGFTTVPTSNTHATMSNNITTTGLPFLTSSNVASPTTAFLVLSSAVMAASQTVSDTSLSTSATLASSLDTAVSETTSFASATDPTSAVPISVISDMDSISSVLPSTDATAVPSVSSTTDSAVQPSTTETSSTAIPIATDSTTSTLLTTDSEIPTSTSSSVSLSDTSTVSTTSTSPTSTTGLLTATSSTPIFTSQTPSTSSTPSPISNTTSNTSPSISSKSHLSTQEIAGISFGALAGLTLLGLLLLALYRRRRSRNLHKVEPPYPESAWLYDPRMSPVPRGATLLNSRTPSANPGTPTHAPNASENSHRVITEAAGMGAATSHFLGGGSSERSVPGALTSNPPPAPPSRVFSPSHVGKAVPHTTPNGRETYISSLPPRTERWSGIPAALQPGGGSIIGTPASTISSAASTASATSMAVSSASGERTGTRTRHTGAATEAQRQSGALGRRATLQRRIWEVKRASGGAGAGNSRPWSFARGDDDDAIGLAK